MRKNALYGWTLALALAAIPVLSATGDAAKGQETFGHCRGCHYADRTERKIGPGLKGLFHKQKLANGQKPTEASVRAMIDGGGHGMPAFKDTLTEKEKDDLLAYLKTL